MLSAQPKVYKEPERNTFRNIFGENEEDYETPLERLRNSNTPFAVKYETKPKSELRIRIEELRKQLLAVIDTSFKNPRERAISAKERDRLLRSIERLEAQEKREKDNALRATGNLPEPISEFEKRQQRKESELVKNALAGKEKAKFLIKRPFRPLDDDPDGETRKMLGLPLRRRKLKKTGKWAGELCYVVPELRYKDYGVETLKEILLCGADEEQEGWLGKWFSRLDMNNTTGGPVRGSAKKRIRSNGSGCIISVITEARRMKQSPKSKRREVFSTVQETSTSRQLKSLIEVTEIEQRSLQAEIYDHLAKSREEKLVAQSQRRVFGEKKQIIYNLKEALKLSHRIHPAMVKAKKWQSEEVAMLKEICSRQEHVHKGGQHNPFWEKVADELILYGFDRQAHAIYFKWMRLNQPPKPKSSKKGPPSPWDCSDTEDEERGEEEIEDYEGEADTKSDILLQIGSRDDTSKPWATGSNWSDEETCHAAPWHSIPESSTEEYFQQNNSKAETDLGDVQAQVSSQQHDLLTIEYAKYNHLDNPVVNKLIEDTGLSREQIKLWYRNQRAIDAKEADLQKEVKSRTEKELSAPILDEPEIQSMGLKRYRVSDIGYHRQEEEEPAKRDKPETFGCRSIIPESNESSANDVAISSIGVQQSFLKPATQRNIPESTSDVITVMKANRELEQQKVHAAEEEYKQLELAIIAHNKRADLELKAANAKERELTVQREIREKATKRIAMIESFLDDY
ncbi:uncharacterized protein Bfra_004660 [Botrytis fragariae]|uniref:Homeobox domain-containing protein n=1 Tax=Botrytis fragariae TaxID=1964551 RepID=A0A8H6AW06_9HELO|nr:uncharacterized protein Bfra_004660 [Botrytis fragariae]KAF5874647.1 hypothetical protein Bfra_004660 [Botrytis fragariae]